ncbi:MAG: 8-amino-7-oxononanoate synthase [Candidatus Thorarchaeota archaeon]|nr:MAG: 8-amino-7-oxononanoate synthase [Candidatus Thorarchaeota archaeon]
MEKLDFLKEKIEELKEKGMYTKIRVLESEQGAWVTINGRKMLNLSSNNYLGLISKKELKEKAKEAIDKFGVGSGAVRTIAGTNLLHTELEKKLAEFKGAEAVILLQSGILANMATIPLIVGEGDLIFSDELNHASIIDGCRLSKAEIVRYKHIDMNDLKNKLEEYKDHKGRKLIVTDGVFSMDGDIAPLPEIVELAEKYNAITMVDDAHGEGVLGEGGRGILNYFHLEGKVDIDVGTLSKAFGVIGGYVAGSKILIEYMKQRARPFLFSTSITPADTAALIEAVDILTRSDELVKKLWENSKYIKEKLKNAGFDIGHSQTPITPVIIGDEKKTSKMADRLNEEGVFVQGITYPTVPLGKARIRVMVSAIHSKEDLDFGIEKFIKIGKEVGVI